MDDHHPRQAFDATVGALAARADVAVDRARQEQVEPAALGRHRHLHPREALLVADRPPVVVVAFVPQPVSPVAHRMVEGPLVHRLERQVP